MAKTILTPPQRLVLSLLAKEDDFINNFYFTGGTALSEYYLQHRLSEDLDFFTAGEIDFQQSFNRNLVFFSFDKGILKAEFTYFPFTQIEEPRVFGGIKVDSLLDIAVNKFFTIYQTPSARHFIDLYLIIKEGGFDWGKLLKLARIKFDVAIDPIQLGSQLITVADLQDLPKMFVKLPEEEWRNYFIERASGLKSQIEK